MSLGFHGWRTGPLGLPTYEFGVTETIGDLLGGQRNQQGGSQLLGSSNAQTKQVLGSNIQPFNAGNPASYSTLIPQTQQRSSGTSVTPTASQPTTFQVQGADTSAAEDARRRYEEQVRGSITSGFDQYENRLSGIQGSYDQARDQELASAGTTYDQIFGGLQDQRTSNLAKLQANRGQVENRQAQSLKDLQQNLSTVSRNMQMQLGGIGAGDTSASQVMAPYAYTKLAGQQEGGIRRQANDQLFEIDQQEKDTEVKFTDMWRQTQVEKEQQLQGIRNYYGEAIRNIQMAMANAPRERQQALSGLATNLLADAQNRLSALEQMNLQRQNQLRDWATNRMSELNNAKLQLQGNANFNPRDIVFQELQMQGVTPTQGVTDAYAYNPMALAQRKRQEYLG